MSLCEGKKRKEERVFLISSLPGTIKWWPDVGDRADFFIDPSADLKGGVSRWREGEREGKKGGGEGGHLDL